MGRILTVLAVALVLIGACSGSDIPQATDGEEASSLFKRAVRTTAGFDGPVHAHIRGTRGASSFEIRSHYHAAERTGTFSVSAGSMKAKILLQHGQVWAKPRGMALESRLPEGASWVTGSVREFRKLGGGLSLKEGAAQLYLLLGAQGINATGEGSVGDDAVRTYKFRTTKKRALDAIRAAGHKAVSEVLLVGDPRNEITGTVAIDGEERVRRFRFATTANVSSAGNADEVKVQVNGTYTDFGGNVEVTPPPANNAVKLSKLVATAGQRE